MDPIAPMLDDSACFKRHFAQLLLGDEPCCRLWLPLSGSNSCRHKQLDHSAQLPSPAHI